MEKKTYTCRKCGSACNKYNCDNCDKALNTIADKVTGRISNGVFEINGKKESDNKLSYELDRYFIEAMAKRMEQNKGKYPPYNRQKPMDVQKLKEALTRHHVEIQKGNYDDEDKYDHLSAIACNAMFIYYQLKNHEHTRV